MNIRAAMAPSQRREPNRWQPAVRELLYCVQFEEVPLDGLDRAMEQCSDPGRSLAALQVALAGKEPLGKLAGLHHPEASVREFLQAVQARLQVPS